MYVRPQLFHPTARHPHTGLPLQAVGVSRRTGRVWWPVMGGAPDDPPAPDPSAPPTDPPKPTEPPPAADPPKQDPKPTGQEVKDLPDWAQKIIADVRQEAGNYRTQAKTAAEKAQSDLVEKLQVALGVKPDPATDPAELAKQLGDAQTTARDSAVQLAVYRAAAVPTLQADPDALLDSTSFMASLKDLDHKAADFGTKVEGAIKAAIEKNSKLKATQAAGRSSAQITGGPGEGKQRPTSLGGAIAAHQQQTAG
jgi:hypothetical protein